MTPGVRRVVHITTVHSAQDPRIRLKQLRSLQRAGVEAHLVTADPEAGPHDGTVLHCIARGMRSRLFRMAVLAPKAVVQALSIPAAGYHLHDPELLPWAWLLLMRRVPVIYDVHEDYTTAVAQKRYLPSWLRRAAARMVDAVERALAIPFTVVIAEPGYAKRFPRATLIKNYPSRSLVYAGPSYTPLSRRLLYTGNITEERGALNLARLVRDVPGVAVTMVGQYSLGLAERLRATVGPGADRLELIGDGRFVPFGRIVELYAKPVWMAGVVLISDSPHYREKQLTKFFEYMAVGLPIIASDFPVWRRLIQDQGVGLCVDPESSASVSRVVDWLAANPGEADEMGRKGRTLVLGRYHWEAQQEILMNLYRWDGRR